MLVIRCIPQHLHPVAVQLGCWLHMLLLLLFCIYSWSGQVQVYRLSIVVAREQRGWIVPKFRRQSNSTTARDQVWAQPWELRMWEMWWSGSCEVRPETRWGIVVGLLQYELNCSRSKRAMDEWTGTGCELTIFGGNSWAIGMGWGCGSWWPGRRDIDDCLGDQDVWN